jgi:hypothetical protein
MILSHRHRYIFIKTGKTAGTSIEIALSKYCGPSDVITPIDPQDEAIRTDLGYPGRQNCRVPLKRYSTLDWLMALYHRRWLAFYNHASAWHIKEHVELEVWKSYFKFCFERNPWDRVVSYYYWRYGGRPRPPISEFVQSGEANVVKGFELYTIAGEIAVDCVYRYERLGEAMEEIRDRVGLPETPSLPRAKSSYREDRRSYREILSDQDRYKIAKVFAREIAHFGYEW